MTVNVDKVVPVVVLGLGVGVVGYLLFVKHKKDMLALYSRSPHMGGIFDVSGLYGDGKKEKRGKEDRGILHVDPSY